MQEPDTKTKETADSRSAEDRAALRELIEAGGGSRETSIPGLTRRVLSQHRGRWLAAGMVGCVAVPVATLAMLVPGLPTWIPPWILVTAIGNLAAGLAAFSVAHYLDETEGGRRSPRPGRIARALFTHAAAAGCAAHLLWSTLGLSSVAVSAAAVAYLWSALHVAQTAVGPGDGALGDLRRAYRRAGHSLLDLERWRSLGRHGAVEVALGGVVGMVGAYALAWGLFFMLLLTSALLPPFPLLLLPFLVAGTFSLAAAPSLTWWCLHDLACPPGAATPALPSAEEEAA